MLFLLMHLTVSLVDLLISLCFQKDKHNEAINYTEMGHFFYLIKMLWSLPFSHQEDGKKNLLVILGEDWSGGVK